jgi:hypothetical protein
MRYLIYFNKFNEALEPSLFRPFMKNFDKERYADIFKKYEGDRNHYRIYLPLVDDDIKDDVKNSVEIEVEKFLNEKGYEIVDYIDGTCKTDGSKNLSKIGKILNRFSKDKEIKKLLDSYNSDTKRKTGKKEDLIVIISRHAYDIAGADTDRKWSNCMTMVTNKQIKKTEEKIISLRRKKLEIIKNINNIKLINRKSDDIRKYENELYLLNREIEELEENFEHGSNTTYLMHDVKEGSLSAFLVKKADKNINNPIATLNIKPFLNKKNDILLVADSKIYGEYNELFFKTVNKWLDEVNGKKSEGIYCINPNLYNDGLNRIYKISDKNINKIIKSKDDLENVVIKSIYYKRNVINTKDISNFEIIDYFLKKDTKYEISDFNFNFNEFMNIKDFVININHNYENILKKLNQNYLELMVKKYPETIKWFHYYLNEIRGSVFLEKSFIDYGKRYNFSLEEFFKVIGIRLLNYYKEFCIITFNKNQVVFVNNIRWEHEEFDEGFYLFVLKEELDSTIVYVNEEERKYVLNISDYISDDKVFIVNNKKEKKGDNYFTFDELYSKVMEHVKNI